MDGAVEVRPIEAFVGFVVQLEIRDRGLEVLLGHPDLLPHLIVSPVVDVCLQSSCDHAGHLVIISGALPYDALCCLTLKQLCGRMSFFDGL